MAQTFKNDARSVLEKAALSTATTLQIVGGDFRRFPSGGEFYLNLLGATRNEVVKVTARNGDILTVERGQNGTSAEDWPAGTLVYQTLPEVLLSNIAQVEDFRQGAYNPNGALTSLYFGEKFYQTDDELWWKAVAAGSTEWRLIAGEIFIDNVGFAPNPGTYGSGQALTMSVLAAGASIYYTDDGSTPDENSTEYTAPVVMPVGTTTYKARGYGANRWESPSVSITSGEYEITEVTYDWQEVIGSGGQLDENIGGLVKYGDNLFAFASDTGRLWEYNGDGSPGWTLRADTPTGFTEGGGSICVVENVNSIWAHDYNQLLEWHTGATEWVRHASPQGVIKGFVPFASTYLIVCAGGSIGGSSIWSFQIAGSNWTEKVTSANFSYANTHGETTAWGDVLCLGFGQCWDSIAATTTYNTYSPTSENTWLRGYTKYNTALAYVGVQNGSLYSHNKTSAWTEIINGNWTTYILRNLKYIPFTANPRLWALQWGEGAEPSLYSWKTGDGSWTHETGNGGLSGSFIYPTDAMEYFNGTLYVANRVGRLAKYIGD